METVTLYNKKEKRGAGSMFKKIVLYALTINLGVSIEAASKRAATSLTEAATTATRALKPQPPVVKKPLTAEQKLKKTLKLQDNPPGYDVQWVRWAQQTKTKPTTSFVLSKTGSNLPAVIQPSPSALTKIEINNGLTLFKALADAQGAAPKTSFANMGRLSGQSIPNVGTIALEANFVADASVQALLTLMRKQTGEFTIIINPLKKEIGMQVGKKMEKVNDTISEAFFNIPAVKSLLNKEIKFKVTSAKNGKILLQKIAENTSNFLPLQQIFEEAEQRAALEAQFALQNATNAETRALEAMRKAQLALEQEENLITQQAIDAKIQEFRTELRQRLNQEAPVKKQPVINPELLKPTMQQKKALVAQ